MKNGILKNAEIKERVKKGLDLSFQKLLKSKIESNGILILSQNGNIRKVKAADLL